MIAKVTIIPSRKNSQGKHPLFVILRTRGKRKIKNLKTFVDPSDWDEKADRLKIVMPQGEDDPGYEKYQAYRKLKQLIDEKQTAYETAIEELSRMGRPFTMDKVIERVEEPTQAAKTVKQVFKMLADDFNEQERFSNAIIYLEAMRRLIDYNKGRDLMFFEMDQHFMLGFRRFLEKRGNSNGQISKVMRTVRAAFNTAIRLGIARQNDYPFKLNPEIMRGLSTHSYKSRSISKQYIDKMRQLGSDKVPEGSDLYHARNLFLIGYLGNGINFGDIARIRWQYDPAWGDEGYIQDGRIYYVRHKTRRKVRMVQSFKINDEIARIIEYYRWLNRRSHQLGNPYVFMILNGWHAEKESRKYNRIREILKDVNRSLKDLGKMIDSPIEITTYVWRHSRARVMVDQGASPMQIQQTLGHQTILTTQHYLKQFDTDELDKLQSML